MTLLSRVASLPLARRYVSHGVRTGWRPGVGPTESEAGSAS